MTRQKLFNTQSRTHIHTSCGPESSLRLIDAAPKVVYKEWLDWIKRCDDASKQGLPKPPLQKAAGEAIFPEDIDQEWWKTDIARRIVQEHVPDEEEGPISAEEDMEAERDELTDEDPLSEAEPLVGSLSVGAWDRVHRPTACGQTAP